jgi:hypothetical protein
MQNIENEELVHCLTSNEKLEAWGIGEWVEEADKCTFEYRGHRCMITRLVIKENNRLEFGHLNGYVHLPPGHPWFGKGYDDIHCDVHGGLTFSEGTQTDWVIGFDTAHAWDIMPCFNRSMSYRDLLPSLPHSSYKNMQFVKNQLTNLVDQAIEAKHNLVE